jgi:nucleoside-diphosphate-sugar epimerase
VTRHKRVLITGVTGLIGKITLNDLKDDHELTGLARRPMEELRHFRGSIDKLDEILPAFEGQDAVVHLAADPSMYATWQSVLPNNLVGTYNVYEACRIHGVKRMVFASSNHATGMYERDHPYHHIVKGEYDKVSVWPVPKVSHKSEIRPDGYYGISKAYGEAMGRYYSEEYGISVICLRIGTVNEWDSPARNIRHYATWLSHRDQAQLIRKSLEAPDHLMFDIFYGVSNNKWRFWDFEHAREVIGYEPQDDAEEFRGHEEF